jgi:DNA mismatch endonuclease (patch repair protein)
MPDNLTPSQRSYCMSRIRTKDTDLEQIVRSALHRRGFRFRKHVAALPGKPDIVFTNSKLVVFIDGDFWHGFRFATWQHRVSRFWQKKINMNRGRDQRNFRRLRGMGWRVIRIWQHQLKKDPEACIFKIMNAITSRSVG